MKKRFITLVLDGFGVGMMPDVIQTREQDMHAHTFKHILAHYPTLSLPTFQRVGALDYFISETFRPRSYNGWHISLGKNKLAHFGADSYIGHQELAGSKPEKPIRQFVRDKVAAITEVLEQSGFTCEYRDKIILVGDYIAVADNIETDYGLNINVVGSLDHLPYEVIEEVGRIVRGVVQVGRVITMGGTNLRQQDFYHCFEIKERDGYTAWGINIPALKIYNDAYRVIHMGYGVDPDTQIPQILTKQQIPVILIGKTADVIVANHAQYHPHVHTEDILTLLLKQMNTNPYGFIFANIQETDLSGHSQDIARYAYQLCLIDSYLPKILNNLGDDDIFVITGDHGNDPTIGHSNHTREYTPLIFFSKKIPSQDLGVRSTLADMGATVASYFTVTLPQSGIPFIDFSQL